MALGDELRADDEIEGALGDLVQFAPQPLGAAGKIRRQHEDAGVWKQPRRFFRETLDAGAAGRQRVFRLAFRADMRARLHMAAMMADQRAAEAMLDQPGVAIRSSGIRWPQWRHSVSGA